MPRSCSRRISRRSTKGPRTSRRKSPPISKRRARSSRRAASRRSRAHRASRYPSGAPRRPRCYDFTMTGIDISAVAESAFAMMEGDEEERAFVEHKAQRIAAAANWFARKKLFFELLEELDATSELASELAEMPELTALMEEAVKLFEQELSPPKTG